MEIADSAHRHDISDEDILHAVNNPVAILAVQDDRILFAATARDGSLLEIVIIDPDSDQPAVIHANTLQPKWYRYL